MFGNIDFRFRGSLGLKAHTASLLVLAAFPVPFGFAIRQPLAEMDFETAGGRIYVPVTVNGHDAWTVLDSGAAASVLDLDLAREWKLPSSQDISLSGAGDKIVTGKMLTGVTATVGGISTQIPYAAPIGGLSAMEGRKLQCIVGYGFLRTHVLEINYARRHLRVFGPSEDTIPVGFSLPLHFVSGLPHILADMSIGKEYRLEGLVDTGATNSSLTTKFLNEHTLDVPTTPTKITGAGIGGMTMGKLFRPDSITIAGQAMSRPILAMTRASGGVLGARADYDLLVGSDLLSRFTVTLDYPHNKIYFQPNSDAARPFEADKTGLRLNAEGADFHTFKVMEVLPGSPAEAAGIKVGDVLESVDTHPATYFTLQALRELFKSPMPRSWTFAISRGGREITVRLDGKSII